MKFGEKRIFGGKMNLNDISEKYPLLEKAIERIKEVDGIDTLFPPQADAVKSGYLEGKNLVLAMPTCSGKTLCAELAILNTILEKGKKAVYLVPLKALASEKYEEFKEKYGPLGIKVAISIGDYDKSDNWLSKYDVIVTSNEKCDSLLRHGSPWFSEVGIIVVDEIHLLNDAGRGPTLEIVLTRLRNMTNAQILALSATIKNNEELAEWLNAETIKSKFRPVKLYKGICFGGKIKFMPEKTFKLVSKDYLFEIVTKTISREKQVLVFTNTRRGSESAAEKIGNHIKNKLKLKETKKLFELKKEILKTLEHHTSQCERLAGCVKNGTAFHHAGLAAKQRNLLEENFRRGLIKVITSTPTLSFGLNLPSNTVIIRDLKRFSSIRGMDFLPNLEIEQMSGRAGRIKYDSEGLAILMPNNESDADYAWENYIKGEPEDIQSKLGVEPVLRTHVLALIASGITFSKGKLLEFFSQTFYAHQYRDLSSFKGKLDNVIEMLKDFGFVKGERRDDTENPFRTAGSLASDEKLEATLIGKRVSELYIDPLTANYLIKHLKTAEEYLDPFALLQLVSNTLEMRPGLSLRKKDFDSINEIIADNEKVLLQKPPNPWDMEYEDYLRSLKTALFFSGWMDEMGEDLILENFGVTPGELHVRLNNADWLLYATQELALLMGLKPVLKDIRKTRLRVKYGIREELLPLVRLKGVGRVRARTLCSANIRRLSDLRKVPLESLSRLIGPNLARSVKDQLNQLEGKE